jgi:hypothetical protein
MTPQQFRRLQVYRDARERFLADKSVCAICGCEFPAGVPPRSPWAKTVDHITPLSEIDLSTASGRAFALSPGNCQAAHTSCNSRRSGRRRGALVRAALGRGDIGGVEGPRRERASWDGSDAPVERADWTEWVGAKAPEASVPVSGVGVGLVSRLARRVHDWAAIPPRPSGPSLFSREPDPASWGGRAVPSSSDRVAPSSAVRGWLRRLAGWVDAQPLEPPAAPASMSTQRFIRPEQMTDAAWELQNMQSGPERPSSAPAVDRTRFPTSDDSAVYAARPGSLFQAQPDSDSWPH